MSIINYILVLKNYIKLIECWEKMLFMRYNIYGGLVIWNSYIRGEDERSLNN